MRRAEIHTKFSWQNLKAIDDLEALGIDANMTLNEFRRNVMEGCELVSSSSRHRSVIWI
jgi:hypothetical protein